MLQRRRITETGPENVSVHRNEKKKLSRKNEGLENSIRSKFVLSS